MAAGAGAPHSQRRRSFLDLLHMEELGGGTAYQAWLEEASAAGAPARRLSRWYVAPSLPVMS